MQGRRFARAILFALLAAIVVVCAAPRGLAQFSGNMASTPSISAIPQSQLIQPEALNHMLQAGKSDKLMVLHVGSRIFFAQSHITGSIYAGPGSQPAGLELLRSRVASTNKAKLIVIYCGCCPWNRCPNLAPAYRQLRDLGFANVKVLYLANNYGDDWAAKGYLVEHGQ
jgi:hypothetical protein